MTTGGGETLADRREADRTSLPEALHGLALPEVLLPYQQRLLKATADHQVVLYEKSRRIGATWGVGADAALTAGAARPAGGMDVLYIGFSLDMAREFIDCCAMWAKAFVDAAAAVDEFLFRDQDAGRAESRDIQAFRIAFASGFEIVALSSRPRSLRGRQGYVIIDEAAFHDDLAELLKAALALLIWGGKVLVISTHDGRDNLFNQKIVEAREGRSPFKVLRTTFSAALADGLYRRICLVKGEAWTEAGENGWAARIYDFYGDGADEELDVTPRDSGGLWLPLTLIEAQSDAAVPVIRLTRDEAFERLPEADRRADIDAWFETEVAPHLDERIDPYHRSALGGDFARSGHLTVFWPVQVSPAGRMTPPVIIEIRNLPFDQQRQVLWMLLDRLPRLTGVALDARGNGQWLAEVTVQKYGSLVEAVMTSETWYRDHMVKLKPALEDGHFALPADADVHGDLRTIELIRGAPRVPDAPSGRGKKRNRHGDAAIAAGMACYATAIDVGVYDYTPVSRRSDRDRRADTHYIYGDANAAPDGRYRAGFGRGAW